MADKFIYLKGKCRWAQLHTPDYKFNADGVWSIRLYPDTDAMVEIEKMKKGTDGTAAILNHLKRDEDGDFMVFKRKALKKGKGINRPQTPPGIVDAQGAPTPNLRIGDGSDVEIKIRLYSYPTPAGSRGSATELMSVMVHNLVPFENEQYSDEEAKLVAGLTDRPKPKF